MTLNKVMLIGNITRDIELRTVGATVVTTIGLAMNESYKSKQSGEKVDSTTYVDVDVWGKTAENVAQYMHKGSGVLIEGKLKLDTWQDDQGNNRSKLKVTAINVQFMPKSGEQEGGERARNERHPPAAQDNGERMQTNAQRTEEPPPF